MHFTVRQVRLRPLCNLKKHRKAHGFFILILKYDEEAILGVSISEGPDAITVKSAGGILGWMDGRLGVTVVLFIWWNGMCMELGGEI